MLREPTTGPRRLYGAIARLVDFRPGEAVAAAWCFVFFFAVLCAYYILRPVRDAMAVTVGRDGQQWLFSAVFVVMLAAVPLFGWIVSRFPRRRIVPLVYGFFVLNLLVFWLFMSSAGDGRVLAGIFFVWVSVFVLFVVSLFWSSMADQFDGEQAKRLYGFISAGGSLGALAGSSLTNALVHRLGVSNLLLLSAGLLGLALVSAVAVRRRGPRTSKAGSEDEPSGREILAGGWHAWKDPYLFRIALWVLLANLVGTYFYIEEQRIVGEALAAKADQVAYFSSRDRLVAILQIVSQIVVTGPLLRLLGIGLCAGALPIAALLGLAALAVHPTLDVVFAVMVAERVAAFGLASPAARVLWTVVTPEDKYKTQSFIDTVVYRGGDVASVWLVSGLGRSLALSPLAIVAMLVPCAIAWLVLTFDLSRRQARQANLASD